MNEISIIIISGLSGSGKSTALKTLEDLGFFCIDNLPVLLLPKFVELSRNSIYDISRVALVMDARERSFIREFLPIVQRLRKEGCRIELIFLECNDDLLIQRFSETRRQHPLSGSGSVREGINREREMLLQVKSEADRIIDSSELNVHQLRALFEEYFINISKRDMVVTIMSFGFKYGVPHDSDIVFDVRFLPNPYFVRELRALNGTDERVVDYVFKRDETQIFLEKLKEMLSFQIPLFEREGKSYLTISLGCTGGRHRSVAIADYLHNYFKGRKSRVYIIHRDLEK